mgnify:CR=1 FL=1
MTDSLFSSGAGLAVISSGLLLLIVLWTLPWKGWALWRAARSNDRVWFVALLLLQTIGILEIVYLFFIRPSKDSNDEK